MSRYVLTFFVFSLFFCQPSAAQEKDSITVSIEAVQGLQAEFNEVSKKVTIQDSIIAEQAKQLRLWKERARQDSTLLALSERQEQILEERIELKEEQIKELEDEQWWLRVRSYVWTVGGILVGFLAGGV